jgi:hypothetical protein
VGREPATPDHDAETLSYATDVVERVGVEKN